MMSKERTKESFSRGSRGGVGSVLTICATGSITALIILQLWYSSVIIGSLACSFGFLPDILSQKCMVIWQTLGSIFLRSRYRRNTDNPYCTRRHFGSL